MRRKNQIKSVFVRPDHHVTIAFFLTTGPTGFLDKPFLDFTRGAPVPNFFFSKLLTLVWSACRFLTLPPSGCRRENGSHFTLGYVSCFWMLFINIMYYSTRKYNLFIWLFRYQSLVGTFWILYNFCRKVIPNLTSLIFCGILFATSWNCERRKNARKLEKEDSHSLLSPTAFPSLWTPGIVLV